MSGSKNNGQRGQMLQVVVLAILFVPIAVTTLLQRNIDDYEQSLRSRLNFEIYLSDRTSADELASLVRHVKLLPGYSSHVYKSRDEVFAEMRSRLGNQLLPDSSANPFPGVIEVKFRAGYSNLANFEHVEQSLKRFLVVEQANFGEEWLGKSEETLFKGRKIVSSMIIVIGFLTFLMVLWVTRRDVVVRRDHFRLLRSLGAGWRFSALPFIFKSGIFALTASVLALALAYITTRLLEAWSIQIAFIGEHGAAMVMTYSVVVSLLASALAVGREI